ncbi:MAG TPA: alpha/beta fold hydrolase, partial [Halococcus sp.]|nr:alpha/beta fold hydrolase [Halococcus sp.]
MGLIQTSEECFDDLPNYPYEAQYVDVGGPEMAYIDEGSGDETFLCLHGEPTWGFLYRKMVPTLRAEGRVIVPDFIGFGRSEKYSDPDEYSFSMHYDSLVAFIEELDLDDITLVCQDWGGILGLSVAGHHPDRFSRLVPMNTGIPSGEQEMPEAWEDFHEFVEGVDELPIGMLIENATATELTDEIIEAYEAPFPTEEHKTGARVWP